MAAKEAAIRKIAPLMLIVCLAHGNNGLKGNTSCVSKNFKLSLVLPNLPEEYSVIIIKCNGSSQLGGIKSTRFEKNKIVKALR